MPRQTAKILPAILVGILAGTSLATMARGETASAEDCLSSPKAETPQGSHWRYRIDHVNKRNCWYLRREGGSLSQALPQNSPSAAPSPSAKPSVADAHAELRQPAREDAPVVSPPANTATSNEAASANPSVWNTGAAISTRWPDLPAASVPNTRVAAAAPASDTTQAPDAMPEAASAAASVADLPISIQPELIPTLIAATIGALAFAGIAALISRRYRTRLRRRKARTARGPVWETTDDDRIVLSDYPSMDNRDYRPRFARGAGVAASPEFVRRAPRRATR
jgi:hypothetical protein